MARSRLFLEGLAKILYKILEEHAGSCTRTWRFLQVPAASWVRSWQDLPRTSCHDLSIISNEFLGKILSRYWQDHGMIAVILQDLYKIIILKDHTQELTQEPAGYFKFLHKILQDLTGSSKNFQELDKMLGRFPISIWDSKCSLNAHPIFMLITGRECTIHILHKWSRSNWDTWRHNPKTFNWNRESCRDCLSASSSVQSQGCYKVYKYYSR
jgi:hypothetical protein